VAPIRTDISEEGIATISRMERINELGTTFSVTASVVKFRAYLVICTAHYISNAVSGLRPSFESQIPKRCILQNVGRWAKSNSSIFPSGKHRSVVRFEIFTAVTMKNGVFWDVTACSSYQNRPFGGT
jgi:hypothetical protein